MAGIEEALAGRRPLREQELDVGRTLYLLVSLLATDALPLAEACLEQMLIDAQVRASIPAQASGSSTGAGRPRGRGTLPEGGRRADGARSPDHAFIRLGTRYALALLVQSLIEKGWPRRPIGS